MFGREDTILAYASSKAAVTMRTIQYANAFRRSPAHAHIKITLQHLDTVQCEWSQQLQRRQNGRRGFTDRGSSRYPFQTTDLAH